jgi:iron(III) transport system substrate-binding protein
MDFVNPNPLPSELNLIDVVKNAPHPAAAKLFEDWVVSQQGQRAIVDITNHTSIRSDVKNDTTVFDPPKWKPVWSDPVISSAQYNQYSQELKHALHASS